MTAAADSAPSRLVPLTDGQRAALERRPPPPDWSAGVFAIGRDARRRAARAALDRAWNAVAGTLGGEDDRQVQAAILAALELARTAVGAGAEVGRGDAVLRLPWGLAIDRNHPLAPPILAALERVEEARGKALAKVRRKRNADERFDFVLPLADLSRGELFRRVARRAIEVRARFEPRIAEAMEVARRAAGRPVRMGEVPEALRQRRALHAVLKADQAAVRNCGLSEEMAVRCAVLLAPVQTREGLAEIERLPGRGTVVARPRAADAPARPIRARAAQPDAGTRMPAFLAARQLGSAACRRATAS